MQGTLKGLILSSLVKGAKTSNEIFDDISNREFELNVGNGKKQKFTYNGTINNVRVDILYLRKHKYIKIINNIIPYTYEITKAGIEGSKNPFRYLEWIENEVKKQTDELRTEIRLKKEKYKADFESTVQAEVDARLEVEIKKLNDQNTDLIAQRAKQVVQEVLENERTGHPGYREAVNKRALELITEKRIPSGTKLFIGSNNTIELNMSNMFDNMNPLVIEVENGEIVKSYDKIQS